MRRPTRQEIDDDIVDHAAALFARHGFRETSVQRIADAAGYSKTGLLHRFPSKQALVDAVLVDTRARLDALAADLAGIDTGTARDVAAIAAVAALALERPGQVALVLAAFTAGPAAVTTTPADPLLHDVEDSLRTLFGDSPTATGDPTAVERATRVATALAGIAVTTPLLAEFAHEHGTAAARRLVTTVALDALGVPPTSR
jgi:AcrR family transcriptional regulator